MVATKNMIGTKNFGYHVGTRAECQEWVLGHPLEYTAVVSNRRAQAWRYRDGSWVIPPARFVKAGFTDPRASSETETE